MLEDRETQLFDSLVYLADTLVTGFDVIDLADRLVTTCQELLDVSAAGIMLDNQRGGLQVLVSSSESMRLLELLQLQSNEGPCLDAFATGKAVSAPNLEDLVERWPHFVPRALDEGFRSAHAMPLALRDRTIGALNLLSDQPGPLGEPQTQIAQVLTSMATIGIVNHRAIRRQELLAEQLQTALNSRIGIEQAKGVIAERAGVNMEEAFMMLRTGARSMRRPLSDVAEDIALGRLPGDFIGAYAKSGIRPKPDS